MQKLQFRQINELIPQAMSDLKKVSTVPNNQYQPTKLHKLLKILKDMFPALQVCDKDDHLQAYTLPHFISISLKVIDLHAQLPDPLLINLIL